MMGLKKGHDLVCIKRETLSVGAEKANDKRAFGKPIIIICFKSLNEFRLNFGHGCNVVQVNTLLFTFGTQVGT